MKNNKNLINYLSEMGVLGGSSEEIRVAKIEWRRMYKREWKRNRKRNKQLRPDFTHQEFEEIRLRAKLYGLPMTTYARELIISAQTEVDIIPCREQLMYILQSISMCEIALSKDRNSTEAHPLLLQAEEMLLHYLKIQ